MLVCKKSETVQNRQLTVDDWKVEHKDNDITGESDLVETFQGQVPIGKTDNQKYLGFTISYKGDNMVNISEMKNKSIWIIRKYSLDCQVSICKSIISNVPLTI